VENQASNTPSPFATIISSSEFICRYHGKVREMSTGTADLQIVDSTGRPISPEVINELDTAWRRINAPMSADRMWQRLLTEKERESLGASLEVLWSELRTTEIWMRVRGGSFEQAIIEVALGLDLMSTATATWLRRELDLLDEELIPIPERPCWRPNRSVLLFEDQEIRRIRMMQTPSRNQRIVEAFQTAGWPYRLDNPLSCNEQDLSDAVRYLNIGLTLIRFRAREFGQAITWERI
jgi:hypothetical protein